MKQTVLLFLFLCCKLGYSQKHLFVVSYKPNVEGCTDRVLSQVEVATFEEYLKLDKTVFKDYQTKSADRWLLRPGKPAVIIEFQTRIEGFTCKYKTYTIIRGRDEAEIEATMAKMIQQNKHIYLSTPKVVLRWEHTSLKKE